MDFELSEEDKAWGEHVHEWVDKKWPKARVRELEASDTHFPQELWDDIVEAGFIGVGVPEEFGGQGGDIITQAVTARELTRNLGGLIATWLAPVVGGTLTLMHAGTEAHKRELLPRLVSGDLMFAIGVTEPGGGTDVLGALRTKSRLENSEWIISGQKVWSTGAGNAEYIAVLATNTLDDGTVSGSNLIMVPGDAAGIEKRAIPKLGVRALASYEVFLDEVRVPEENLLGDRGVGWKAIAHGLNQDKILLAACSTGILDGVLEDALRYTSEREAFGKSIDHFQTLQNYIVDIASWRHISGLVAYHAAWLLSEGRPVAAEATMAKLIAAEYANKGADLGIQILGGMGYSAETDMQRYWRDSRLWRIAPITSEMSRNFIARSLGMPRGY